MYIGILACDDFGGIGKNNKIPWKSKSDLKHFKSKTIGNICIMGRSTFDSIGKPLPNRVNVVFTKNSNYSNDSVIVCNNEKDISHYMNIETNSNIYIIGGAQIYKLFENKIDKFIVTKISGDYECDTFYKIPDNFILCDSYSLDDNNIVEVYIRNDNE